MSVKALACKGRRKGTEGRGHEVPTPPSQGSIRSSIVRFGLHICRVSLFPGKQPHRTEPHSLPQPNTWLWGTVVPWRTPAHLDEPCLFCWSEEERPRANQPVISTWLKCFCADLRGRSYASSAAYGYRIGHSFCRPTIHFCFLPACWSGHGHSRFALPYHSRWSYSQPCSCILATME